MKILMLVNWKVKYCEKTPEGVQPPDYYVKGEPYWFFRYFKKQHDIDVLDASTVFFNFEKKKLRFHLRQGLKAIPKLNKYDLIISHGMQSAIVVAWWRSHFKTKCRHLVFEIGSFNSAREDGKALKMMQKSSKSIDCMIYHTSKQVEYYKKCFPFLVERSHFLRFGTDIAFFRAEDAKKIDFQEKYIICVGYIKRDWDTLVKAYQKLDTDIKLYFVGKVEEKYLGIKGLKMFPYMPVDKLKDMIYNAEFCVLPLENLNYSFGQMTLMQQMALKKCVLCASVPSLTDYVIDNKTALLYNPMDEDDLKEKMQYLILNPNKAEEIGNNAREFLEKECNEKVMAEEIEKIIDSIEEDK